MPSMAQLLSGVPTWPMNYVHGMSKRNVSWRGVDGPRRVA